jgi:hypothetical protein
MSSRLFKLTVGGRDVHCPDGQVWYFTDKAKAKVERDRLQAEHECPVQVRRGPDHHKGEST